MTEKNTCGQEPHSCEPKPRWLKRRLPSGPQYEQTRQLLKKGGLHTVCQEANCPNIFECFSKRTATFLILGDRCTRNCSFCNVTHGAPGPADPREPKRVAQAAAEMNLAYVVVTSVTRDDLPDGGAGLFGQTIEALREAIKSVKIEVLIPDFQGDAAALARVLDAGPDVLNHNIETVPRLYPRVRPQADYRRSLELLHSVHKQVPGMPIKSGLMLGLGETDDEIQQALEDLRKVSCSIVTLGQYLRPTPSHHPVKAFVAPEQFDKWRKTALEMGFCEAACGPFVRSSYQADAAYNKATAPSKSRANP